MIPSLHKNLNYMIQRFSFTSDSIGNFGIGTKKPPKDKSAKRRTMKNLEKRALMQTLCPKRSSILNCLSIFYKYPLWYFISACIFVVSGRLVEAENMDCRLFRVSVQRLIKWFEKSCPIFKLGLLLTPPIPSSLPTSIVCIQRCINSPLSRKASIKIFSLDESQWD